MEAEVAVAPVQRPRPCRRRCSAGVRSESSSTPARSPRARARAARRSSGVVGRPRTRRGLGGGRARAPARRTTAALARRRAPAGPSDHQPLRVWAAVLSASNAASSRCWRRRLGSWLASAATNPISSSRSSSVAARRAPSWWARIPNTSRSQSVSSNRNSRSAAATSSEMTISLTAPGEGEPSAAQVVRRVLPVADDPLVVADAAPPLDRRWSLGPQDDHPPWAGSVGRSASAWQRAFPGGAGIAGCGRPDDVAQVLGQATCGPGVSSGKSRKWCRSVTNIPQDCTGRSVVDVAGT